MTTLASVVLGALLALAGGIWTERWKQRKEARAAARLVWLELMIDYSTLQGAVALEEWPAKFTFSEDAWMAQRDRLALVRSTEQFQELQTAYFVLRTIAQASPGQRSDPVLYWPALVSMDRAVRALGEAAGVERTQLDQFQTPLQDRLAETRRRVDQIRANPRGGQGNLTDDAVLKTLDEFPPEFRTQAAEALARAIKQSEPKQAMDDIHEPASEDSEPPGASGSSTP